MTKELIEKEIQVHEYKAARHALAILELEQNLENSKMNLERETGAVLILKALLNKLNETPPTPEVK